MTRENNPFDVARDARARAALVSGAISARAAGDQRHYARLAPGLVRIRSRWRHSYSNTASPDSRRGKITAFTDRSRRRLRTRAREAEWPRAMLAFLTLTWPRHFSSAPADWYADLRAWRAAYERRFGNWVTVIGDDGRARRVNTTKLVGIWVREFQGRGAPHYHLAIAVPRGTTIDELREWSARTWYRTAGRGRCQHDSHCTGECWFSAENAGGTKVCRHADFCKGGEGDCRHLAQHLKPAHCKKARSRHELLGYLAKEISKCRQKELPAWLVERDEGAGRWWGVWNLPCVFLDEPMSRREFHTLRRVGRGLDGARRRARGKPPRRWRSWSMQGISIEDRTGLQWSLAQACYGLMLFCRGKPARSSYAKWDQLLDRGLQLFPDTT